jgi:hypothetical protein
MMLAVFTALVGLSVAPVRLDPLSTFAAVLAIAAGAGAAGVLNMWYSGSETPNIWQKCSTVSAVEMSGFGSRAFIHRRAAADEIRRIVSEPVEAQEEMMLAA